MTIAATRTDAEFVTLVPMAGMQLRSFGQPSGIFFMGMDMDGDASGGIVALAGDLSFTKKQEFFYEWQMVNAFSDSFLSDGDQLELTMSTGPRIPDPAGVFVNPTYRDISVGAGNSNAGNTVWDPQLGQAPRVPVVCYGDITIPGVFNMMTFRWTVNDNGVTYFAFGWGYYYAYQTLFRALRAAGIGRVTL